MIILAACGLYGYPEDVDIILKGLSELCDLELVNKDWDNVSYGALGPHSITELILKTVYPLSYFTL
jgi:hypothetical protein